MDKNIRKIYYSILFYVFAQLHCIASLLFLALPLPLVGRVRLRDGFRKNLDYYYVDGEVPRFQNNCRNDLQFCDFKHERKAYCSVQ